MNKRQLLITILLFILIFSLRMPYVNNSIAETGDMWRQPDTESIARNFVHRRFNILYPQLNYDGAPPNYVQLEFQITTFLIAILYRIFGEYIFLARLVPIVFFMISVYYLFKLVREAYNIKMAWFAIIVYSILPLNLYYSRAIMPESAVLCFLNGGFYYFYKWYKEGGRASLYISGLFTALAISQKTPAIFIGLAMLAMCIEKYGLAFLKKIELWVFGFISLLPPLAYILWSGSIARHKFVAGIGTKHIIPNMATAVLSHEAVEFYKTGLPQNFTTIIIAFFIAGLFTFRKKSDRPVIYLFISMILETIFIVSVIRLRYYLIFLGPVIGIVVAKLFNEAIEINKHLGYIFTFFSLAFILNTSYNQVIDDFAPFEPIEEFVKVIDEFTEEDDLIVVSAFNPIAISMSNRMGWRANIKYYDYIPKDVEGELNYFIENGAMYFITNNNVIYKDDGEYLKYLEENFESIVIKDRYKFYKLSVPVELIDFGTKEIYNADI